MASNERLRVSIAGAQALDMSQTDGDGGILDLSSIDETDLLGEVVSRNSTIHFSTLSQTLRQLNYF